MRKHRNRLGLLASAISALGLCASSVQAADDAGRIPITTSSKEAREQYKQGWALQQTFQPKEAAKHYQQAVTLDPSFALGYLGLANTLPTAKDFNDNLVKAEALADKASEGERLWIQGVRAGADGNPQKQLELYQKLVALHPNDERSHLLLGLFRFARQEFTEAVDELNQIVKIDPKFSQAYNMLGYAYRAMENYPEAEKAFKRYTEVLSDNPNPFDSYAEFLLKTGRFDESIVQYRKALAVDPHFVASRFGIASDLMYQGKYDEARKELDTAYETARDDGERRGLLATKVAAYLDEGHPDKALEEVQKMYAMAEKIQDAANMSADLGLMGVILLESGKPDEAQAKFEASEKAIAGSGLSDEQKQNAKRGLLFTSARVALAKHDLAGAKAKAQEFLAQATANKNVFQARAAHQLAGMIALDEKNYDGALTELKQASLQDPYTLFRMAQAYEGKGDAASARTTYEKVAKYNILAAANYSFVRTKALQKVAAGS
jgi:tetratricopeptide (TPR) repeat protein